VKHAAPVALAVSSCLLGEAVRYDGAHKAQPEMLASFGSAVRWIAFCPEVMAGMGVPRPHLHMTSTSMGVRVVRTVDAMDQTEALRAAAAVMLEGMDGVCGFVFKSRSPSCGLGDAELRAVDGEVLGKRDGLVAAAIKAAHPDLPVANELELASPEACTAFLARARAYGESD
jgi:uncharacterized protein YbbK (DUF523 family)